MCICVKVESSRNIIALRTFPQRMAVMFPNHKQEINFENGKKYYIIKSFGMFLWSSSILYLSQSIVDFRYFSTLSDKSNKGCETYYAKSHSDKEVLLTTWLLNIKDIKELCPINCDHIYKCCNHKHGDILTLVKAFKERANYLIENVDHKNLIRYIDVSCTESNGTLTVYLVQEYIKNAKSVRRLSADGILPNLAPIAQWIIKVISYLKKMKPNIYHGYINDASIFVDYSGTYRFADYNLIPYLMYLKGTKIDFETNDLKALGSFLSCKTRTARSISTDFIEKCCSGEHISTCQELLAHEFLSNVHIGEATTTYTGPLLNQFQFIEVLGRGVDGCVIKVKQPANGEEFALKIIKVPIASKGRYTKVQREINLIPKLSHKHIVKYFAHWEQTIDINELGISFVDDEDEFDGSDSAASVSTSNK